MPGQPNVFMPEQAQQGAGLFTRSGTFNPEQQPLPDEGQWLPRIMSADRVPVDPQRPTGDAGGLTAAQQDAILGRVEQAQESRARRGGGMDLSPEVGQFGWALGAQDFAPAGYRPNESRSTQIGKYGGSPLYAAALAFPHSAIASRLQGIAQRKEALAKKMAEFDPLKGVEDVKQPEYRDGFQRAMMDDIMGQVNKTKQLWGDEAGIMRLMNGSSKEAMELRKRVDAWTTIARLTNQGTDNAIAVVKGMDNGTLEPNPYLYNMAKDQLHKTGVAAGEHDPIKLAQSMQSFAHTVSLDDQVHKDGISALLKNAGSVDQIAAQVKAGDPLYRGGFAGILHKKTINRDAVIETLVDRYEPQYKGFLSREELKKYFTAIAGNLSEETLTQTQIRAPRSGDGGSGTGPANAAASYTVEQTAVPEGTVNAFGTPAGSKDRSKSDATGFTGSYPTITLFGSSNKQAQLAKPLSFRYGNMDVFMYPERIMQVGSMPMVLGKEVGMPRTTVQKAKAAKSLGWTMVRMDEAVANPESEDGKVVLESFATLRPMMVPLTGNEAQIEGIGYDIERVRSVLGEAKTPKAHKEDKEPQPAKPAAPAKSSGPPALTADNFEAEYKKLPPGAEYIDPNGQLRRKKK